MKDQISAFMDGEMSLENAEHLLASVKAGGEPAQCWKTYHLIGDLMRGNSLCKHNLTEQIMQQLDTEPTVLSPKSQKSIQQKSSIKKSTYWSVAASVAAVMFVGWMVMQQQVQTGNNVNSIEIAQNLPSEYLEAHQSSSPSGVAFYIQPASYNSQGGK